MLRALNEGGAQLLTEGGVTGFYMKLNTTKPPLDDVNCRLALAKAFDYDGGVKIIAVTDEVSQGTLSTGAIPAAMLGANPREKAQTRDLDAARQHLADCRYSPDDFVLEVTWIGEVPLEERFALLMQANFAEIGIDSRNPQDPVGLVLRAGLERRDHAPCIAALRHCGDRRFRHAALRHVPLQRGGHVAVARAPE